MRISDWSSDVCSSDLRAAEPCFTCEGKRPTHPAARAHHLSLDRAACLMAMRRRRLPPPLEQICTVAAACHWRVVDAPSPTTWRSEEHTSELQSLMRISYAVFCLKKKKKRTLVIEQKDSYIVLGESK